MTGFFARSGYVEAIEMNGEWVMMDVGRRTITKLYGVGGAVWSKLDVKRTLAELTAIISEELHAAQPVDEQVVFAVLQELIAVGLVKRES